MRFEFGLSVMEPGIFAGEMVYFEIRIVLFGFGFNWRFARIGSMNGDKFSFRVVTPYWADRRSFLGLVGS